MNNWNELTLQQQIVVNWAMTQPMEIHHRRVAIANAIDAKRIEAIMQEKDRDIATDELQRACAELADPFFTIGEDEEGNKTYTPVLGLTKCPWPELVFTRDVETRFIASNRKRKSLTPPTAAKRSLYACADEFANMTVYELSHVWSYLDAFGKSGNERHLAAAIAVIYRVSRRETEEELESDWQGDRRRGFYKEESLVDKRIPLILTLPPQTLSLLYTWMVSCRQVIIDEFEVLFKAESETAIDPNKPDFGWAGLLLQVADGVVDLERVANHGWRTVFTYLAKLEHERREMELKQAMRQGS